MTDSPLDVASGKVDALVTDGCTQDGPHDPDPCPRCTTLRAAIRDLRREAFNAGLERAAVCVLEDKPFSGLGLAAAIRALKEPADGR